MTVMYNMLLVYMRLLNMLAFYVLLPVHGNDLYTPLNTAVVAGNPMSITCGMFTNSLVKWNFKNPNEFGESFVYDGSRTFSNFSVTAVTNGFSKKVTLTKISTQMEDAGIYKCLVDQQDQLVIRTAHLIVLETDPDCGTNASSEDNGVFEGTYLKMWCSLRFSGDPAPLMKWSRNDGSMYEGTLVNSSRHISYSITKSLTAEDNGKIYSCTTFFQPISSTDAPQSNVRRAKNAPNYRYQWNFTAVVWFFPKNLHVEPLKESYNYGDRLLCWGDGNTTLTYRWKSIATGAVTNESYLIIDDTITQNVIHVYECIAVLEKSHWTISKTVNITIVESSEYLDLVESKMSPTTYAIMFIGSVCIILLVIVIGKTVVHLKEVIRPDFPGGLINEPDIVQYAENEGDYAQPEELFFGNLPEHPEEQNIEQDLGATGRPLDDLASPGLPIYSEINNVEAVLAGSPGIEVKACDPCNQPVFPVYAAVRKTIKEPSLEEPCVSSEKRVYAEVNKNQKGLIRGNQENDMSSDEEGTKQYTAALAYNTEYLDMTGLRMLSSQQKTSLKPMFSLSDYAAIDHTPLSPPPPKPDY